MEEVPLSQLIHLMLKLLFINQKLIIQSLSMDLLRVALGLHHGSSGMASTFRQEALKRIKELEESEPNEYLRKLAEKTRKVLSTTEDRTKEDALMYSVLFQNFARKYGSGETGRKESSIRKAS